MYQRWVDARLLHRRRAQRQAAVLHRHPAAQRHRQPAHGPRARPHADGRADPPPPDAGLRGAVAARHGPRRHRRPRTWSSASWPRRAQSRHDLGREAFVERVWEWKDEYGGADPRPDAPARRRRRLDAASGSPWTRACPRRPDHLQAALRRRADLPRRADHQLVPALPHRAVGHRGRAPRGRGRAGLDPLRRRGRQRRRRHHPGRDDARRHRGRRPPRRRALRPPGRRASRAAAGRPR